MQTHTTEKIITRQHLFSNGSRLFTTLNILRSSFILPFNQEVFIIKRRKNLLTTTKIFLSIVLHPPFYSTSYTLRGLEIFFFRKKNKSTNTYICIKQHIIISSIALLPDFIFSLSLIMFTNTHIKEKERKIICSGSKHNMKKQHRKSII